MDVTMMTIRVPVLSVAGASTLAGKANGRGILARFIAEWAGHAERTDVIWLDFSGVEVVTASFFREAVLAFRDYCLAAKVPALPVVVNASALTIEEVGDFLEKAGDAMWFCRLDDDEVVSGPCIVGKLDPTERETLALLNEIGRLTARDLINRDNNQTKQTAWNNRLASVASKGLVSVSVDGKRKIYSPLLRTE